MYILDARLKVEAFLGSLQIKDYKVLVKNTCKFSFRIVY